MPIKPGTKLGPYEVQDYIGQGAMGVVYRAYHAQLERTGAVKVLHGLAADADSTARFRREAQSIARMRHPNVLNVFDFGEFEGTPYMIVEFVEGGNLSAMLQNGPLDRKTALGYLRGIAGALDYAHSRGIVHRDVKPANVLLGTENTPILADFGLAKLMESSSIKSITGVTTGTPAYMAPEQVTGSHVGPAADRYSLAVIAYQMLTGFLPFDEGGVLEVLYAQVHREPLPPSGRNRRLGPRVDAVIMRGLAKDPEARWDSCGAFITALDAALGSGTARQVVEKTIAFAPPVPAHVLAPAVEPALVPVADETAVGPYRGPDEVIAMHPPVITRSGLAVPGGYTRPRRLKRGLVYASISVLVLILVALLGFDVYDTLTRPIDFAISPQIVSPGGTVTITAGHLPGNQKGNIELRSALYTYGFQANGNGNFSGPIIIPTDIDLGYHTLSICWNGACRGQKTLQVVSGVAFVTPGSPALGVTPSPSIGPTPSHGPSPTPGSTPSSKPVITISTYYVKPTGNETVTGFHFSPGSTATVSFVQGSTSTAEGRALVSSAGGFSLTFKVPGSAVKGPAAVKVCDGSCLYSTVDVTP